MRDNRLALAALLAAAAIVVAACGSSEIDPDRPPLYDYEPPPLDGAPGTVVPKRI